MILKVEVDFVCSMYEKFDYEITINGIGETDVVRVNTFKGEQPRSMKDVRDLVYQGFVDIHEHYNIEFEQSTEINILNLIIDNYSDAIVELEKGEY